MESRRRGGRILNGIPAPEEHAIVLPETAVPYPKPPFAGEPVLPPAEDDPAVPVGDSPSALAMAEEALARAPEPPAESAPLSAALSTAPQAADTHIALDRDSLMALARSQAAVARGLTALGFEMAGMACSEFEAAARAASRLLAVRTPSEAIRVQADYIRGSLGAALAGSARLSNLGVKLVTEAAEPLVVQFGRNWLKAVRRAA